MSTSAGEDTKAIIRQAARAFERDRYLAALLAPRLAQHDLLALIAFSAELRRIPFVVREPMMGRIRLQWWRDAITAGEAIGHPIADALRAAIDRHGLARPGLLAVADAAEADLEPAPFSDRAGFLAHHEAREGELFALAAACLGSPLERALTAAAGRAYGIARALVELPAALAHGARPLPGLAAGPPTAKSILDAAADARLALEDFRRADQTIPRALRPAFAPLALVQPYLKIVERAADALGSEALDIMPMTRVWRIWWACRSGQIA